LCRPSFPPDFQSRALGVGRFAILALSVSLRFPSGSPGPRASLVVGVGSSWPGEEEDPLSLVWSADLRSADDRPLRIEPEAGQVAEYSAECPQRRFTSCVSHTPRAGFHVAMCLRREEAADILNHHQSGLEGFNGSCDVQPQTGPGPGGYPGLKTGQADVLAGESGAQDVDRLDLVPVDGGDVAVVGDVGPVVGEDLRGVLVLVVGVVLAVPGDGSAEDFLYGLVQPPVSRAERAGAGAVRDAPSALDEALGGVGRRGRVHRLSSSASMSNPVRRLWSPSR